MHEEEYQVIDLGKGWGYNFRLEKSDPLGHWFVTVDRVQLGKPQTLANARTIVEWLQEGGLQSMHAFFKEAELCRV